MRITDTGPARAKIELPGWSTQTVFPRKGIIVLTDRSFAAVEIINAVMQITGYVIRIVVESLLAASFVSLVVRENDRNRVE